MTIVEKRQLPAVAKGTGGVLPGKGGKNALAFARIAVLTPRGNSGIISLAGPASNLILAALISIVFRLTYTPFSPLSFLYALALPVIFLNVALAVFNLIPVHPLDGGKILVGLLPSKEAREADLFLGRYGMIILFLLIFPTFGGASPVSLVISPIINFLLSILAPASSII